MTGLVFEVEAVHHVTGRGPVFTCAVVKSSAPLRHLTIGMMHPDAPEVPFRVQWDSEGEPHTGFVKGVETFANRHWTQHLMSEGSSVGLLIPDGSDTIEPGTVIRTI